jgi:hypothetical protein
MKTSDQLHAPVALSPLRGFWSLSGHFEKRSTLTPTGNIETRRFGGPASSLIPHTDWAILPPQFIIPEENQDKAKDKTFVYRTKSRSQKIKSACIR